METFNLNQLLAEAAKRPQPTPAAPGSISTIDVKILDASGEKRLDKNGKPYVMMLIDFKTLGENPQAGTKKITQFAEIFKSLCNTIEVGKCYSITRTKSKADAQGRSYWDWTSIHPIADIANDAVNNPPDTEGKSAEMVMQEITRREA